MSSRPFHVGRAHTGLGLFATRVIKRAGYIATYRGPILTTEEAEKRERQGAKYMFELTKKLTIDGSPRSNVARYMNHSCWPNAKPVIDAKKGRITFVALRDIMPGEEITYNYGKEYYEYFLAIGGCLCAGCRIRAAARKTKKTPPAHTAGPRKANGTSEAKEKPWGGQRRNRHRA
jgi:SET domain-containing protein